MRLESWVILRFFILTAVILSLTGAGIPQMPACLAQDGSNSGESKAASPSPYYSVESNLSSNNEQLRLGRSEALSHYWLANSYFKKWNLDLAAVELRESVVYWPDLQAAHKDLTLVYLCSGHPIKALAELMMLVGLGEPIPLDASERVALNDEARKLHYKLGIKHGTERDWMEAVTEFLWALTYAPNDAATYRSLAFAYGNCGNFERAEELYQTIFKMNPTDAFSHADFAFMLTDKGRNRQAEQQLSQAVRLAPSAAALHVDLGWSAEAAGDFAVAEKEFQAAVGLSPSHGGLWSHLGRILEHEGKKADAIEAYHRALKLDPGQDDARQSLAKLEGPGPS